MQVMQSHPICHSVRSRHALVIAIVTACALLQACASQSPQQVSQSRAHSTDVVVHDTQIAQAGSPSTLDSELIKARDQILFVPGALDIPSSAEVLLDRVAMHLKNDMQAAALLVGHTENLGSTELAVAVSERYVMQVKKALLKRGVRPAQVRTIARGYIKRQSFCKDAACPKAMRRVVILLSENQPR